MRANRSQIKYVREAPRLRLLPLDGRVHFLVHSWSNNCYIGFQSAVLVAIRAALSRQRSLSEHSWRSQGNSAVLSPRPIRSARPWVDYRNRKILKMRCVSCGELRVRSKHDAGNHCVAQFTWTSLFMTHSHQIPSLLRRGCMKRSHSTLDLLNEDSLECLKQG
jgi:hypothetical protein